MCQHRYTVYICITCMQNGNPTGEWKCIKVGEHDPYTDMMCVASRLCQDANFTDPTHQTCENFLSEDESSPDIRIRKCDVHRGYMEDEEPLLKIIPNFEVLFRWAYFKLGAETQVAIILEKGIERASQEKKYLSAPTENRCLINEKKIYMCKKCSVGGSNEPWLEVKAGDLDVVTGTRFFGGHTCSRHVKKGVYSGYSSVGIDEDNFYLRLQCEDVGYLEPIVEYRDCHIHTKAAMALSACFYAPMLPVCLRELLEGLDPDGYAPKVWDAMRPCMTAPRPPTQYNVAHRRPGVYNAMPYDMPYGYNQPLTPDPTNYIPMELDQGLSPSIEDAIPMGVDPSALYLDRSHLDGMLYQPQPYITCGDMPGHTHRHVFYSLHPDAPKIMAGVVYDGVGFEEPSSEMGQLEELLSPFDTSACFEEDGEYEADTMIEGQA
ncbi:hypothetical protein F5X99DRAFT_432908 [Biscogniauxia marginata]|nr:hypothetical protein F5X99DRAFT_432908 [Biscogniauxia marginata]